MKETTRTQMKNACKENRKQFLECAFEHTTKIITDAS